MNCIKKINKKKNERNIHNTSTYHAGFSEIQIECCDKQLLLTLQLWINSPEFDDTDGSGNGSCCQTLPGSIIVEWHLATFLIKTLLIKS